MTTYTHPRTKHKNLHKYTKILTQITHKHTHTHSYLDIPAADQDPVHLFLGELGSLRSLELHEGEPLVFLQGINMIDG